MTTSADLSRANDVETGVQYTVTVVAINDIGSSAESNRVTYNHAEQSMNSTHTHLHLYMYKKYMNASRVFALLLCS